MIARRTGHARGFFGSLVNACTNGCGGSYAPAGTFVRSLGVTAYRTSGGWIVRVRFSCAGAGVASSRHVTRSRRSPR